MEVLPKDVQLIIYRYLHYDVMRQVIQELRYVTKKIKTYFDVHKTLHYGHTQRCKTCKRNWIIGLDFPFIMCSYDCWASFAPGLVWTGPRLD